MGDKAAQAGAKLLFAWVHPIWPTGLHEQTKAVAELLSASPAPLALIVIEAGSSAPGRWRD